MLDETFRRLRRARAAVRGVRPPPGACPRQGHGAGDDGPDPAAVGGVALYDIDPESWQHRACRIANRNLSWDEWIRYIGSNVPYQRLCPDLPNGKDVDEALGRGDTEGH